MADVYNVRSRICYLECTLIGARQAENIECANSMIWFWQGQLGFENPTHQYSTLFSSFHVGDQNLHGYKLGGRFV